MMLMLRTSPGTTHPETGCMRATPSAFQPLLDAVSAWPFIGMFLWKAKAHHNERGVYRGAAGGEGQIAWTCMNVRTKDSEADTRTISGIVKTFSLTGRARESGAFTFSSKIFGPLEGRIALESTVRAGTTIRSCCSRAQPEPEISESSR